MANRDTALAIEINLIALCVKSGAFLQRIVPAALVRLGYFRAFSLPGLNPGLQYRADPMDLYLLTKLET